MLFSQIFATNYNFFSYYASAHKIISTNKLEINKRVESYNSKEYY